MFGQSIKLNGPGEITSSRKKKKSDIVYFK